jgi:hypothetical protein
VSRSAIAIAAALTLPLSGCGGAADAVTAERGVVEISLVDFRVKPQIINAKPDSMTIRIRNDGRLPHAFRIRGIGGTRLKVPTILPGRTAARVGVRLPRGDWRLFCPLSNHEELGMYGTLVIR